MYKRQTLKNTSYKFDGGDANTDVLKVKKEEFFNTASGLFVITTCFYYDCQQLSTYKSSNMDIPQV